MYQCYRFEAVQLPYSYGALEPYIDAKTMEAHYNGHLQTYVNKLNAALAPFPQYHNNTLESLLCGVNCMTDIPESTCTEIKHNGGGVYNHNFFFLNLYPNGGGQPVGELGEKINLTFGSFASFKTKFKEAALGVFGSGYAWLTADSRKNLCILTTPNQDVPIIIGLTPIMCIDVWEHAYYLKHMNKRGDYIDAWFNVVNVREAEKNYENM